MRAELLKVRSTRTTLGLVVGMILLTLLIVLLSGLLTPADGLTFKPDQLNLVATGGVAVIFSGLAGVLLVTSEYRYGTIHPTFLFTPRRSRVLSAKFAAGLLAGLVFGLAGVGAGSLRPGRGRAEPSRGPGRRSPTRLPEVPRIRGVARRTRPHVRRRLCARQASPTRQREPSQLRAV